MNKEKCCGNCKHFKNEDVNGAGLCCKSLTRNITTYCYECCVAHEWILPTWKEITPYNVDELKAIEKRVVVANKHHGAVFYRTVHDVNGLDSMAQQGGYYYYILPELNINGTE